MLAGAEVPERRSVRVIGLVCTVKKRQGQVG